MPERRSAAQYGKVNPCGHVCRFEPLASLQVLVKARCQPWSPTKRPRREAAGKQSQWGGSAADRKLSRLVGLPADARPSFSGSMTCTLDNGWIARLLAVLTVSLNLEDGNWLAQSTEGALLR